MEGGGAPGQDERHFYGETGQMCKFLSLGHRYPQPGEREGVTSHVPGTLKALQERDVEV